MPGTEAPAQAVPGAGRTDVPPGDGRRPPGRPTRTLKNLLQEREIPIWQREKLPLLFHEDRLVWVPGVGIAADYACPEGKEGFQPSWRVAGKTPVC